MKKLSSKCTWSTYLIRLVFLDITIQTSYRYTAHTDIYRNSKKIILKRQIVLHTRRICQRVLKKLYKHYSQIEYVDIKRRP